MHAYIVYSLKHHVVTVYKCAYACVGSTSLCLSVSPSQPPSFFLIHITVHVGKSKDVIFQQPTLNSLEQLSLLNKLLCTNTYK